MVFVAPMPLLTRPFTAEPSRSVPRFEFHSNFWMNFHHTLFREAAPLDSQAPLAIQDTTGFTDR